MDTSHYLSITELNQLLNRTLEDRVGQVSFEGEISELKLATSGHLYAAIKDEASQASVVMWAQTVRSLSFKPVQGMLVRCLGRPNVYHKTGRLQMVILKMAPSGEGLLQKKFLELKLKLEKEGLFSEDRKRPIPFLPRAIGIVTSAQGAAIHDMLVKLRERMPQVPVYLVDVRVQGEGAAHDIAAAISYLSESALVDVMIVGRGGGSLEDLWSFNEEVVVRAIFASRVPVISAVGHEVDVSLADLVADLRAPTPTAAAELVVPRRDELLRILLELERRLLDYERWFNLNTQLVDDLAVRLGSQVEFLVRECRTKLERCEARLGLIEPTRVVLMLHSKLDFLGERLMRGARTRLDSARHHIEQLERALANLSPRRVLERGYSIVEAHGAVLRSATQVQERDELKVILYDGGLRASVTGKE